MQEANLVFEPRLESDRSHRKQTDWQSFALIFFVAAALFSIRQLAPPNLLDQDQSRPAAYVLDALENGNWICQRDWTGDISSKPPLYTWVAALLALLFGRLDELALYLPGALGAFGIACMVWRFGGDHFGQRAGLFAALAFLLTGACAKEFGLARTDGVFAFMVSAAALLAFRAWNRGSGWTWFWLFGALSTLTKGPLGVALAAMGLMAVRWERNAAEPRPLRGSQMFGVALFIAITVGWFALAYWKFGQPLIQKMLLNELFGHVLNQNRPSRIPGSLFYQPPLYYLGRAAPWSIVAILGFWRVWKTPARETNERRFERFLFCWFFGGLAIFSFSSHQRADLLWPIMPAGALIAGRELDRFARRFQTRTVGFASAAAILLVMSSISFYYFITFPRKQLVRETVGLKRLAAQIEARGGKKLPLYFMDVPRVMEIYLNTAEPSLSPARTVEVLRGPDPAFVVISNFEQITNRLGADASKVYTLLIESNANARVIGNRPTFP